MLNIRKLLASLCAGAVLCVSGAMPVYAETAETQPETKPETYEDGMFTFAYVDGGVELYACDSSALAVNIPETTDGYKIVSIGASAFYGCQNLKSVVLSDNIQKIGEAAFMGCSNLIKINVPESVEEIGNYAFYGCSSLESIDLPDQLTAIPEGMFYNCEYLQTVDIPENVESIGLGAFYNCALLPTPKLPETLTTLGDYAFAFCYAIDKVELPSSVTTLGAAAYYGCINITEFTLPREMENMGYMPFMGCVNLAAYDVEEGNASYVVEDGVLYNNEKQVLYAYPAGKKDESFVIPEGVTAIQDAAFFSAVNLKEIQFPSTLKTVGAGAFEYCEGLTEITLPQGVQAIHDNAFADCTALHTVHLPSSLSQIGNYAFYACPKLLSVTLPDQFDKETLGSYAFGYTDGNEVDADGLPIPVEIEGFRLKGGKGISAMTIALIVLGAAVLVLIIFLLVRVIRKTQLTAEEQQEMRETAEEEELKEEDKVYVKILDSMQLDAPEEDETDYEATIDPPEDTVDDDDD